MSYRQSSPRAHVAAYPSIRQRAEDMNPPRQVLLAHPGTQYSHRLALELNRMGGLTAFHTGMAFAAGGWADRCVRNLPNGLSRRLASRRIDGLPPERLHCHPFAELSALLQ